METPHAGSSYECAKCGHGEYDVGEVRAAGSTLTRLFDVEGEKFTAVICGRCGYTDLYKAEKGVLEDVLDFFTA
jgi:predicted nucleic-acid-binding Zn-ribbon protein